jgi:hypothetical protein
MRLLFSSSLILTSLLLGGCGTTAPALSITQLQSQQRYIEKFTQAYVTHNAAGDYEVVLIDDPLDGTDAGDAGQPLAQSAAPSLRQVLHIRLLWRPLPGAKADSPAATNASLHWYVLGGATVEGTSLIHYAGTAFVAVVENGPGAEVTIHNGFLKTVERHGDLIDPLKSFKIDGKFEAVGSDTRLGEIMTDVKSAMAEAKISQPRNHNEPPGRAPAP